MIICLGEALIDLVPPPGESPATAAHLDVQPGGAPLNVCIALNRLGSKAAFLGTLSEDAFGRRLRTLLNSEGIVRAPLGSVADSTRLAVIDPSSPNAPFRFYGDRPADAQLTTEQVQDAFETLEPSGVYVGSLQMTASGARDTQIFTLDLARRSGIPIYADPNPRPAAWPSLEVMRDATAYLLERATLAKLSLDDAAALGWPGTPEELHHWSTSQFDCALFVTGGSLGCWTMVDGKVHHAVRPKVEVVDPTGAGDASFAALISRFHPRQRLEPDDLAFAATVGAIATQRPGAVNSLPTQEEALRVSRSS